MNKEYMTGVSFLLSIGIFMTGYMLYRPSISVIYGIPSSHILNMIILLSLISGGTPLAAYSEREARFDRNIERNMSTFFTSMNEGVKSGLSIVDSISRAGENIGGPIGRACTGVARKVYMGMDFSDSLEIFAKRLGKNGRNIKNIILAAYLGGEDIEVAFSNASKAYMEHWRYRMERAEKLKAISYVGYIGLFVLLLITYVLVDYFLPGVSSLGELRISSIISTSFYESALLWMSIFIALTSPVLFSKIAYGDPRSGVKHVVIMLVITYIFFNYILPIKIPMNIINISPSTESSKACNTFSYNS